MKKFFSFVTIIALAAVMTVQAQNRKPDWARWHYLSEEEMYTPVRNENFTETPPPTGEPRFVGEFEPMQGVMIRYPLGIPTSLVVDLANNYLYQDLLTYKGVKKPETLQKLVRALALQIGSEVSYNELARIVELDKATVESYIDLLEKCFVVFRLPAYSRNMRTEIKKGRKIYFYDNGIRNALISNFAPLELRNDVGALWENMMVCERLKRNVYSRSYAQMFFWRTQQQQEIDLIEEMDGRLSAFEFKWRKSNARLPKAFTENYPESDFSVVTPDNYLDFISL